MGVLLYLAAYFSMPVGLWIFDLATMSYMTRSVMLIIPVLLYRKTKKTKMAILLCNVALTISRIITFLVLTQLNNRNVMEVTDTFFFTLTGVIDLIIVYIYYCAALMVTNKGMKEKIYKSNVGNMKANKIRNVYMNYLWFCMLSLNIYIISGVWDYTLRRCWYFCMPFLLMFYYLYCRVTDSYDSAFGQRYMNVSSEE